MGLADAKFKTLKQIGAWNVPTPEEEKILAHQTKVKSLRKNYKKKPAAKEEGTKPDANGKNGKLGWPEHHNRKSYQSQGHKET
eukprot:scaffold8563_cov58-Attheya_sp.AAC.2